MPEAPQEDQSEKKVHQGKSIVQLLDSMARGFDKEDNKSSGLSD